MRFKVFTTITLLLFTCIVTGQTGYFSTDSSSTVGITLVDGGDIQNAQFCQVHKGDKIIRYTPNEVTDYGFEDGRVYFSRKIHWGDSSKTVFLRLIHKGNTKLYYYKEKGGKMYFIEKDSTVLIEIPKKDINGKSYSELLLNNTDDCPDVADAAKLVSYNNSSLSRFISQYNNCELKPFPFFKYGIFFGAVQSKLTLKSRNDEIINNSSFTTDNNPYFGVFVDAPLYGNDLSFFSSLGIYQSSFSANTQLNSYNADILINQTTLKVPLMIRYTVPSLKVRPYINAGVEYSYNVRNESIMYKATVDSNIVQFHTPTKDDLISNHQVGYVVGAGMQYHINYKRIVFVEIRYNKEYSLQLLGTYNKTNVEIISGINF